VLFGLLDGGDGWMFMPDVGDPEIFEDLEDLSFDLGHGHVAISPVLSGDPPDTINERPIGAQGDSARIDP
jgi:hypothetical protein